MIKASFDFETSMKPIMHPWQDGAFPVSLGLYFDDGTYYDWWFNHKEVPQWDSVNTLQAALTSVDLLIAHNIKFDLNWLRKLGVSYDGKLWCTQTTEYLLRGQQTGNLTLAEVAVYHGASPKLDIVKEYWDRGVNTDQIPKKILGKYMKQDCVSCLEVQGDQEKQMRTEYPHMRQVITIHNATSDILSDIEMNGMPIDVQRAEVLARDFSAQLKGMDVNLIDAFGRADLNLNSKDELSAALYGGIIKRDDKELVTKERWATRKKPFKFTYKDGRTTTKYKNEKYREKYEVERKCIKQIEISGIGFEPPKGGELQPKPDGRQYYKTGIEIIKNLPARSAKKRSVKHDLIERSKVAKLVSTLVGTTEGKGYLNKIQADGRMHPQYNQSRTGTGRYSSKDPNGQNFPRSKEDQDGFLNPLKTIFVPSVSIEDGGLIGSGDLGQLEWRIAAFLSQDPVAMDEIRRGIDAHADNATRFFGDIKFRQDAKIMTFRLLYGGTAYSFFMDPLMPNFSLKKWNKIVEDYYRKYYVLKAWQEQNIRAVEANGGWYQSQFGRIFRFPLTDMSRNVGGSRVYYKGYKPTKIKNYEVQGTATGDVVPFAMHIVKSRMGDSFPNTKWIGQVHDSILYDTIKQEIRALADLVIGTFEDLPGLIQKFWGFEFNLPLTGDFEAGPNYGEMKWKAYRPTIGAPTEWKNA
jgi:DNA polymerase-1